MRIQAEERARFWADAVQRASEALDSWKNVHGPRLAQFGEVGLARGAIHRAEGWLETCVKQRDGWNRVIADNT